MTTYKKNLKEKLKDKGSAMVIVIIAIAFIGMLVAMILYMSYANYVMKSNDRRAKDNFYTAESVLDIINVGLQKDVSDCMSQAYVKVMQSSSGMSTDDMTSKFREYFVAYLRGPKYLQGSESDTAKYDLTHLSGMWDGVVTKAATEGSLGAYLSANGGKNTMIVSATNSYILLNNLHVVYTDEHGFVSIINTDIRIETPTLDFAASSSKMNLENYSIIANTSLVSDPLTAKSGVADTNITGNVFGGYDGIKLANQNTIRFIKDGADMTADMVNGTNTRYNLAAGSINVDNVLSGTNRFYTGDNILTYVDDVNVTTGRVDLNGETFVADDLDVGGKRSEVILSGKYYGYGGSDSGSNKSSSILINGADTLLNFTNLTELMLSGHAYVGAMKYDADKDRQLAAMNASLKDGEQKYTSADITSDKVEGVKDYKKNADQYDTDAEAKNNDPNTADKDKVDVVPQNLSDVMMGESISVKANQLLYLVPSDCVGYIKGTNTQVVTKNPMTYDEFVTLRDTEKEVTDKDGKPVVDPLTNKTKMEKKYDLVRLDQLWTKLGGTNYTDNYNAVYRRINGTVMVYLYLDFANEQMANQFYRAYLKYDPKGISDYVSSYVRSISWSPALKGSDTKLTLAANAFDMNTTTKEITLIQDNNDSNHTDAFMRRLNAEEDYTKKATSLMHTTTDDYSVLSVSQESNQIFDNLVDVSDLSTYAGRYTDTTTNASAEIKYFVGGEGTVYYPADCNANTHAIITNGDVVVSGDYEGVILARGTVYIAQGCNNIQYNPGKTIDAFRAKKTGVTGTDVYAYQVFGKSGELTYGILTAADGNSDETAIKMVDLISYENWKKD